MARAGTWGPQRPQVSSGTNRNQNASSWHLAHGDSSDVGVSGLKGEKISEINTHRKDAPQESWGHRKSQPEAGC